MINVKNRIMKLNFCHSLIFITTFLCVADGTITSVCDVEGSGIDDCSSEQYCCEQSECDSLYNRDINVDSQIDVEYDTDNKLRCCDITELEISPLPSDCKLCTKCCEEAERNRIPLPNHCSKCRKCVDLSLTANSNQSARGNFQVHDHSNEATETGASKQKDDSIDTKETTYLAIGITTVILLILITSFLIYYFKIKARNNENIAS